jgi:hypothetical protein
MIRDRPTAKPRGENLVPMRRRLLSGEAAIDDGPAGAVLEQPQIDVVEREGQRHAQPADPRRDRYHLAGRGRRRDRKMQHFGHSERS